MSSRKPKFSIILAGGKGTRMRSADRHKVCFLIDGRAAINRALDVYQACGIAHHIIVVGAMAGQVIETVGREHEGLIFAYQAEQLGTGHATRQGLRVLEALSNEEDVLLVAGDRIIEPFVLEALIDLYYSRQCDMAFLVGPKGRRSDRGRVLLNGDGSVLANVEVRDIWQRQALGRIRRLAEEGAWPLRETALQIIGENFDERRAALAFGDLWQTLAKEEREPTKEEIFRWIPPEKTCFSFTDTAGRSLSLTPEEVDSTELANFSVYLLRSSALRYALDRLTTDNAQREEYLSDIITILAQARESGRQLYRVEALRVENPNYVLAFNDPAELLEVEAYFQQKKRPRPVQELPLSHGFRPIADWIVVFQGLNGDAAVQDKALQRELISLYGNHPALLQERCTAYLALLDCAARELGSNTPVLLVRAPGRVNIMGRHIDHQGGHCNLMAIDREILLAVHPRRDDQVHLYNVDETRFGSRRFSIGELLMDLPWDDWMSLITSEKVQQMVASAAGDWSQYVKAAVLRLQKKFPTVKLRGMDLVLHGNIPIAAGLSSSSAVVVASAEATVAVNRLEVFPSQFVDLCGEGEWFVGTRGGSADHAAMKFSQKGKVVKVTFFDFGVEQMVDFPSDYRLVICNSLIKAHKSAGARDVFNHRIACYRIGVQLVKAFFPQYAPLIQHLRDINVRNLGVPLSWIYRILLRLPERATREELEELLPSEKLAPFLATHAPPKDGYPIRGVVLFGLAECERGRLAADFLAKGQVAEFGRLMNASHDGDRVVIHDKDWRAQPYPYRVSNSYLLDLIEALESGDPERVIAAQLPWQPGAYSCSTPEIDLMVDIALRVPGVVGAQLAGAGLGGCMMVLAHQKATSLLSECMQAFYYAPRGLPPAVSICTPIAGSGLLLDPRA